MIITYEDFAPDAMEVRKAVVEGTFKTEVGPDGAEYTGISDYRVPHWFKLLEDRLQNPIEPKLSCFRINYKGELPHSWVHSDDICAKFATVLYLNPMHQCRGGTAFWRHVELGMDRLPSKEALTSRGVDADAFYQMMDGDWKQLNLWKRTFMIPMKFNRLITYPTCMFHSRFPFEGFGSVPKDGRLIWICFYDLKGS